MPHMKLFKKKSKSKTKSKSSSPTRRNSVSTPSKHRLSPAKSVSSLYRSASHRLSRDSQATTATLVASPPRISPEALAQQQAEDSREEQEAEGALYKFKTPVAELPPLESQDSLEVISTSNTASTPATESIMSDKVQKDVKATTKQAKATAKDASKQVESTLKDAKKDVESTLKTAAKDVEKAASDLGDRAERASKEFKARAEEAGKELKKSAGEASEKAENFVKKVYADMSSGVSSAYTKTKETVQTYPVGTFNVVATAAAGATAYALNKNGKGTQENYKTIGAVLGGTLALVDSVSVYLVKTGKLKKQ